MQLSTAIVCFSFFIIHFKAGDQQLYSDGNETWRLQSL